MIRRTNSNGVWILRRCYYLPNGEVGIGYVKGSAISSFVELTGDKEEAKKFPTRQRAYDYTRELYGCNNRYTPIRLNEESKPTMTIALNVSYEEAQIIRMGIAYAVQKTKSSAKLVQNDPLELYRCTEIEKSYKALLKKITTAVDAEIKKAVDNRKNGGV